MMKLRQMGKKQPMTLLSHVHSRLALDALSSSIRQMKPIHGLQFFFTVVVWLTLPKHSDTLRLKLKVAVLTFFNTE